jgi:transcriptional regulator with XRE-family HTH domain
MTLGQAIRSIRKEAGLSQKELAQAAGIDQSYLSMIESGQRRNPGTRIISRLALALRVSIDDLAARAGLVPEQQPRDPLTERALHLFRQLPRWRQHDVIAQLELYLRLKDLQPRVTGEEEGHEQARADQVRPRQKAA